MFMSREVRAKPDASEALKVGQGDGVSRRQVGFDRELAAAIS